MTPKVRIIINVGIAIVTILGCIGECILAKDEMNKDTSNDA